MDNIQVVSTVEIRLRLMQQDSAPYCPSQPDEDKS